MCDVDWFNLNLIIKIEEIIMANIPIITIDGASGTGKGSLARTLAKYFNYHLLDSGAIYRALAIYAQMLNISFDQEEQLTKLAVKMPLKFMNEEKLLQVYLGEQNITTELRLERTGNAASQLAKFQKVRLALIDLQHCFVQKPGLVADGRDMGTVIFPNAMAKIFLTASAEVRAKRRYLQLSELGVSVNIGELVSEIKERDERDQNRTYSPLIPASDAFIIETSALSAQEVMDVALSYVLNKHGAENI